MDLLEVVPWGKYQEGVISLCTVNFHTTLEKSTLLSVGRSVCSYPHGSCCSFSDTLSHFKSRKALCLGHHGLTLFTCKQEGTLLPFQTKTPILGQGLSLKANQILVWKEGFSRWKGKTWGKDEGGRNDIGLWERERRTLGRRDYSVGSSVKGSPNHKSVDSTSELDFAQGLRWVHPLYLCGAVGTRAGQHRKSRAGLLMER